jgi:peptide/nickel transport system ATP-binding protein
MEKFARDAVLLEVEHLRVVDDDSFPLRRAKIVGLAGESESGKSTQARPLHSPARVTAGRGLSYPPRRATPGSGEDEPAFPGSELAVVLHSTMNALNPLAICEARTSNALRAHRPALTRELARLVGIRLTSYLYALSEGMRQRNHRALAVSHGLAVTDEPTTALDVVIQRDLLTALLRLRQHPGLAGIFITHGLSRRSLHLYTQGVLHSFPTLAGPPLRLSGSAGAPADLRPLPSGCVFYPRCPQATSPGLWGQDGQGGGA